MRSRWRPRGVGRTGRVPSVGCVIVAPDGRVLARGRTDESGRPHAEAVALAQAGAAARGATAYVTLEPCSHIGTTGGPCADLLIAAGVARVVIACGDPDPRVNGGGIAKLKAAGIAVDIGIGETEARATLDGFFSHIRRRRPYVTLKIAQSLDGKTATALGDSKWITGPESRRFGHLLRARNDAILVGIGTVLADDPELTCPPRGTGALFAYPGRARLAAAAEPGLQACRHSDGHPDLAVHDRRGGRRSARRQGRRDRPGRARHAGRADLNAVLAELSRRNVTRLLVEGGGGVHAAFLDGGLADALEIFIAPMALGGGGHDGIDALAAAAIAAAPRFTLASVRKFGSDLLESYRAKA